MISIKHFLDGVSGAGVAAVSAEKLVLSAPKNGRKHDVGDLASVILAAYRSLLEEMGRSSVDACAATGQKLSSELEIIVQELEDSGTTGMVNGAHGKAQRQLSDWGRDTARHFQQKTAEVKEILMVMAQTAQSVGDRDQRCAQQITAVTTQLRTIANLEDLTLIRNSIGKTATELKNSIDRMNAEGKAALDKLQAQVTVYQTRLEEAEEIASCDWLTRLRSRLWMEGQMEKRAGQGDSFCIAILDMDGFKGVNDTHGHLVGDDLLKQFAGELRSACRSTDLVGRWGGDEFLVLMECDLETAQAQTERLSKWVCGNYTVEGMAGTIKLRVDASIGLAEFRPPENLKQALERADAGMYRNKAAKQSADAQVR